MIGRSAAVMALVASLTSAPQVACDQRCQIAQAWAAQEANALPRSSFYDVPHPLPPAPAGTLIRARPASGFAIDPSIGVTRILYHSRDSRGNDVASAGVVLVPPGPAPKGGWPLIAYAHGTSGAARACAPSLMKDLFHGGYLEQLVDRGYAVIATDYAGLGTDGRSEFGNKTGEADDVLGALGAARTAVPSLGRNWVALGHSLGGQAVLGVAEQMRRHPVPGYLGAAVTAPATHLPAGLEQAASDSPGAAPVFVALFARGAKATYPRLRFDRVLAPEALRRLPVLDRGCVFVDFAVYSDLHGDGLVRPGYLREPYFARFLRENDSGQRPISGPLLIQQGGSDTEVLPEFSRDLAARLCRLGAAVDFRLYPGLIHDTTPGVGTGIADGAIADTLSWIDDRFAGVSPTRCA